MNKERQQKIQAHIFELTGVSPAARNILNMAKELRRDCLSRRHNTKVYELCGRLEDEATWLLDATQPTTQDIESRSVLCDAAWGWRLTFTAPAKNAAQKALDDELHKSVAMLKGAVGRARREQIKQHEKPVIMAYVAAQMERFDGGEGEGYCDARR